ncbi:MAG: tetratricopeptide repeat protein [Terracidiphilus sp.]
MISDQGSVVRELFARATEKQQAGSLGEAAELYGQVLAAQPDSVAAHFNLGIVRQGLGDLAGAVASFEQALALRPELAEAHNSLGLTLRRQEKLEEAKAHYERALALKPEYADAWSNLGVLLRQLDELDASEKCLTKALSLRPENAGILDNLGNTLRDMGRLAESAACHERTIALDPRFPKAHNNLGYTLRKQGKLQEARSSFELAVLLDPRSADIRWNLCLLDLLESDFAAGWRGYEVRHERKENRPRSFSKPQWRGEPLDGARILLHSEQGLGDSMQFLRYVPMVVAAGGRVILNVPATLRRLAAELPEVDTVTVEGEALPEFAWHCPLLSLPLAFKTTLDSIPSQVPYLKAPEEAMHAADRLEWPEPELRVGLVWSGNPKCAEDRMRSMALKNFEPLLEMESFRFFSLQLGTAAGQLDAVRGPIMDLRPAIHDFADTAALVEHLDLVITVDTSVAHLAGALAKPTWLLLPFAPDWRWLLEREDSPWYPTMRIFRQAQFGDWAAVMERVRSELAELRRVRAAKG